MQHYLSDPATETSSLDHPSARAIATQSVATFRDRYLISAAEACYLRRMILLYAEVQNFKPRLWKESLGEDRTPQRVPRGYDWEYFSYKEPCQRAPEADVDRSKVDFEDYREQDIRRNASSLVELGPCDSWSSQLLPHSTQWLEHKVGIRRRLRSIWQLAISDGSRRHGVTSSITQTSNDVVLDSGEMLTHKDNIWY